MKVLLFQLDGKLPNIALMRLAAYHRRRGDDVELRRTGHPERTFWDAPDDLLVYGSTIFLKTRFLAERLREAFPQAIIGGTGWDYSTTVEQFGVDSLEQDYSIYPKFRQSIGFSQRGCRLRCEFCVVPKKEGKIRPEQTVADIWRGDPWPRELLLLDNDFFGQPKWRDRIREIRDGNFKVSFVQGINARCLTEEAAEAIASVDYRDDGMSRKQIYTAWDNRDDEKKLFDGLGRLVKYGVKPRDIMVYMLCGFWPNETQQDREYRRQKLREFGAVPYPIPYVRTTELIGFQRWVIGAYDKKISWSEWSSAQGRPERLGRGDALPL